MIIRGLSLTRPWPFAFKHGKLVENRSWRPPSYLAGCYFALHAARSWSEEDREFIADRTGLYVPSKKESPHSQIFAVVRWRGEVAGRDMNDGLPGIKNIMDKLPADQDRWFFGPFGWLFKDYVELREPIACTGALGLWTIRPTTLEKVRTEYAKSKIESVNA